MMRTGVAALLTIICGALIFWTERGYPFAHVFHYDIATPTLALELSGNKSDIDAVLHPGNKAADQARRVLSRVNRLDLIFIPCYTFFLWSVLRLFGIRSILPAIAIAGIAVFDYWEDWRISEALSGKYPAVYVPSLAKWGLLAFVLLLTGFVLARAGGAVFSIATNRLLAIAYWLAGLLMAIAVLFGRWLGYSLISLSVEIFSMILIVQVIGLLGPRLAIPANPPNYHSNFCQERGKPGKESLRAVEPSR